MKKVQFDESSRRRTGRGFYAALAICLLAVGAGAFSTLNAVKTESVEPQEMSEHLSTIDFSAQEAENKVTGVPAESETVAPTTKIPTTAKTTEKSKVASFFVMPIGGEVSKKFNADQLQFSETYNDWRLHTGIDISVKQGEEVRASGDGVVKDCYNDPVWGYTVVIDHGNDVVGYYHGLTEKFLVKKDQVVAANDPIGAVGNIPCESVEKTHLHFAIKEKGKNVDPLKKMELGN